MKLLELVKLMTRAFELQVTGWFRRLADETGAFSIQKIGLAPVQRAQPGWTADVVARIRPAGQRTSLILNVETKSRITPAEALATLDRMKAAKPEGTLVLCVPAISERVAEMCRQRGIGYLDEAGNCRISGPGLFLHIHGHRNARPDTRPTVDVFATKSSRIIRVLLTHPKRGWQVQALAAEAQVSLGLASKTKRALVEQAFAEERDGLLYPRQPEQLLREWSKRYSLSRSKRFELFTLDKLQDAEQRIAEWCRSKSLQCVLTQFSGAWRIAPMVRYNRAAIYVESVPRQLSGELGLKPVSTGANLVVWTPFDPSVFYDQREMNGVSVASPIQLYLDLIGEPGRGEEAAQEILEKAIKPTW